MQFQITSLIPPQILLMLATFIQSRMKDDAVVALVRKKCFLFI